MSDFFYKEKLGPVFSPVIKVKQEKLSPTVVSAIDNLLSPMGNMFTRAETVRNLMKIEKLSLEKTSKVLSLNMSDVANKLRLLEFSQKERSAILEYGFSEQDALCFLSLDKITRLYAIEYCHKNFNSSEQIHKYVNELANSKSTKKQSAEESRSNVRKSVVNDIGFVINSIENTLRIAKKAGFEVENEKSENEDGCDIHISVKKQNNTRLG